MFLLPLTIILHSLCVAGVITGTKANTNLPHDASQPTSIAQDNDWEFLDSLPLASWYDDAKFGIFIHWGVFSVPSYGSEWFWQHWQQQQQQQQRNTAAAAADDDDDTQPPTPNEYQRFVERTERRGFAYADYAARFRAELYEPQYWAQILADAGAQYVVLTAKHHEGFCMWNSTAAVPEAWNWNVMDVGPRRDVLGDLAQALRSTVSSFTGQVVRLGIYHSLYEWFNPLYRLDKANNWTTQHFVDRKTLPALYDLVQRYQPALLWSDGDWEAPSSYWKSTQFLKWYAQQQQQQQEQQNQTQDIITTNQPVVVWNDRWGNDAECRHGAYLNCVDRYQPGQLQQRKWEGAFSIDTTSWGNSRSSDYTDYLSVQQIVHLLIETVAYNGNMLLNIGPAADGTIPPIFIDRLTGIGKWLHVNGPAIYGTRPWQVCQNESSSFYYTRDVDRLYVHMRHWKTVFHLDCPIITGQTTVTMLGLDPSRATGEQWDIRFTTPKIGQDAGLNIILPALTPDIIPCDHAWVLVFTHIANLNSTDPVILARERNNHNNKTGQRRAPGIGSES